MSLVKFRQKGDLVKLRDTRLCEKGHKTLTVIFLCKNEGFTVVFR